MTDTKEEIKEINRVFEVGVFLKFIHGFLELLGGIVVYISGGKILDKITFFVAKQEIIEDPHDIVLRYLVNLSDGFSHNVQFFTGIYLMARGLVNVFLAIALLKNKLWAYPAAITIFTLFIVYQIYLYLHTQSLFLLLLIMFDFFVVLMVRLEYKIQLKKKNS